MTAANGASSPLIDLFNSTKDDFDTVTPQLWGRAGSALVDALDLTAGNRVLDVCSGTGASALPAASAVGADGAVVAVDFAGDLLEIAQHKAQEAGLSQLRTVRADVTALRLGIDPCQVAFDAVACSYGIFFLPDMESATRGLMDLLRPGGRIGVTVWHANALNDFSTEFFAAVTAVAGAPNHRGPRGNADGARPITRIDTVDKITDWFTDRGAVQVRTSVLRMRIPTTEEFAWSMVMGSGMRGALSGLDGATRARVRAELLVRLRAAGIDEVDCDTVIAVATV